MCNTKGFTLIELMIVVAIISILALVAIPGYIGQQRRAVRTEAYTNLENLRLLEEQFYAESGRYTISLGVCAANNPDNVDIIQLGGPSPGDPNNDLPGFRPGPKTNLNFSYCIETNRRLDGGVQTNCFRASAFGNAASRASGDIFRIDCNNNRNF